MIPIHEVPDNISTHSIYEMARLGVIDNWTICVFGNEGPIPHFHMRSPSVSHPENECCIRFDKPEYFDHGSKNYKLSKKTKKQLINLLNEDNEEFDNITNWELLIRLWNLENKDSKTAVHLDSNIPMPDYTKL